MQNCYECNTPREATIRIPVSYLQGKVDGYTYDDICFDCLYKILSIGKKITTLKR